MKTAATWFGVIVVAALFAGAIVIGFDRNEEVECLTWASQAKQFDNYYITSWQKQQCDAHGITIEAPVK